MKRLPIIGVVGSHAEAHEELSTPLGQFIAQHGCHLLTGGGGGVMSAVAKSFVKTEPRQGMCIGIVPIEDRTELKTLEHYSNPYIEIPIITQLSDKAKRDNTNAMALNAVNVLTSDVVVVLPGLHGTKTETSLALFYDKPVILFGHSEDFDTFPTEPVLAETLEEIEHFMKESFHKREG